ncbi:unnamed protein product, partial [Closterium sp. Naga37s-1]
GATEQAGATWSSRREGKAWSRVAEERIECAGATEQPGATWSSRREGKAWCRSGRAADRECRSNGATWRAARLGSGRAVEGSCTRGCSGCSNSGITRAQGALREQRLDDGKHTRS